MSDTPSAAHGTVKIAVPAVVACAIVTAAVNLLTRQAPAEAHASTYDDRAAQDIRELRADEKEILRRLGGLEDSTKNLADAVERLRSQPAREK
jgi:hypothetical protein